MIDIAHGKGTELGKQMDFCGKYTGEDRILRLAAARGQALCLEPAPWSQQGPAVLPTLTGIPSFNVGLRSLQNRPLTCNLQLLSHFKAT